MSLSLTTNAVKHLKDMNLGVMLYLRLSCDQSGEWHTAIESRIYNGDTIIHESDNIKVVIDQWSDKKLNGFILDFSNEKKKFDIRKEDK